ncbi:unannotated protein [freshwater metagenome]|uniref:Unannotated protein n=1 Tax=freshwater metagenome TaxID=449393 RepID=A0A6J7UFN3_9ZZZZ
MMDGCVTQCCTDLFRRDLLLVQVLLHDRVGGLSEHVHERIAIFLREFLQVFWDVYNFPASPKLLAIPHPCLHGDEIDDASVIALGADRQLNNCHVCLEAILDRGQGSIKICPGAVHLVDETHARDFVVVSLAPHGLCLWLYAGYTVEHRNGAV